MPNTDCQRQESASGRRPDRRTFTLTLLATLAGALVARRSEAFVQGAEKLFAKASQALRHFGVSVTGTSDRGHDVLRITALPEPAIQYDFAINEVNEAGGIVPCVLTSFFEEITTFTHYEMDVTSGIQPCTRTTIAEPVVTFEHLDVDAAGGILPCVKTVIDTALTTFELFDEGAFGGVVPCVHVGAERLADGGLGEVVVSVNEPDLHFVVRIGTRVYRLVDGQLVEQVPG